MTVISFAASAKALYSNFNLSLSLNVNFQCLQYHFIFQPIPFLLCHLDLKKIVSRSAAKKLHVEKLSTDALQDTIHRQRELIGKLISVIVKDRLKNQDKPSDFNLKDGDISDVEKLLNFTDSQKNSTVDIKTNKTATISFSSGEHKKRSRTSTGEKKVGVSFN